MTPRLRKLSLTVHIATSLGWLGAVAAFLALAIVGLATEDIQSARAAYLATEMVSWLVIVPLSFASLLSGLVQSWGTAWGLLRHYWVTFKLLLTTLATIVLLVHTQVIDHVAATAGQPSLPLEPLSGMQTQLVVDAAAAILILLATTVLAVYKPRGLTRYGQRKARARVG
ncbi:hypothetical protein [Amycolatopsis keratiniphila]|uniref:hypothetical protein n=1 Tax=Amycolatopsis keratiniphila TaxID=129921 RepID=UPI00087A9423|nr:hypothetical protein [Amycolatopsis keratiniphila]OLZ50181.1 hypothetical protein BS330_29370 [Amycolatopsis keratiniphila subsp. nogabecina]SDU66676.1 hypothetical protein SAMN04489733_7985 [Amycolatopsis keratiniphila]